MTLLDLLLKELRTGDPSVAKALRSHYTYLVLERADDIAFRYRRVFDEYTGQLFLGLATAIDRLAKNDVESADVESFILSELERSRRRYGREISRNLLPKASTNTMRRRKGLEPYEPIMRVDQPQDPPAVGNDDSQDDAPVDFLEALRGDHHLAKGMDGEYYRPSSLVRDREHLEYDVVDALVKNEQERKILAMLLDTYSQAEIASELGVKPSRVRTVIQSIRQRATRIGLVEELKRTASGEGTAA